MSIADRTVDDFLEAVANGTPSPGGGAVAAIGGAAGAALCEMVCRLSIEHRSEDEIATRLDDLRSGFSEHRSTLVGLADEDAAVIRELTGGGGDWDRNSFPERRVVEVPLETATESLAVLEGSAVVAKLGFGPAIGDAGTGGLFAHACCKASLQNVRINLRTDDERFDRGEIGTEVERIEQTADETLVTVHETVKERT